MPAAFTCKLFILNQPENYSTVKSFGKLVATQDMFDRENISGQIGYLYNQSKTKGWQIKLQRIDW